MHAQEFIDRVSELLRTAGYTVYGERIIGHRQVDLYVEHVRLEMRRRIAVECKIGPAPLKSSDVDQLLSSFLPLYHTQAIDELLIVTEKGLSPAAAEHLQRERFAQHLKLHDLEQLVRGAAKPREYRRYVPLWGESQVEVEGDYCFVLMPFGEEFDLQNVYRNHVKPVVEKRCLLRCERADDIYDISGVMQSVWDGINRARVVVAELTGRNPNVFYELGVAHTLGKPVVMLSQDIDDVPSDLRYLRCILYRYKPDTIDAFEAALEKTIKSVLARS